MNPCLQYRTIYLVRQGMPRSIFPDAPDACVLEDILQREFPDAMYVYQEDLITFSCEEDLSFFILKYGGIYDKC